MFFSDACITGTTFCPLAPLRVWLPCCPQGLNKESDHIRVRRWGTNKTIVRFGGRFGIFCVHGGGLSFSFHLLNFHEIHEWWTAIFVCLVFALFCINKTRFIHVFLYFTARKRMEWHGPYAFYSKHIIYLYVLFTYLYLQKSLWPYMERDARYDKIPWLLIQHVIFHEQQWPYGEISYIFVKRDHLQWVKLTVYTHGPMGDRASPNVHAG